MATAAAILTQARNGVLDNVCMLTLAQRETLVNEGYDTAKSMCHWKHNHIRKWAEKKITLSVAAGRCAYGDRMIKAIQGLAHWCTFTVLRGEDLNDIATSFDTDALEESILEAELDYDESKESSVIDKPDKFTYDKWQQWEEAVYNYFAAIKNSHRIPLSYVIRKEPNPIEDVKMDDSDHIVYNASLQGAMFKRDSKRVLGVLRELTIGSQADTWMKGKRCGREAMKALQAHYDGATESGRRLTVAKADLIKLFYQNESTFSFEKYVTKLLEIFNLHQTYKVPLYEKDKVDYLLDKINCPDKEFQIQVSITRSSHSKTFVQASTYLQTEVSRIFPEAQPGSGHYNKRRYVKASQGGGRG